MICGRGLLGGRRAALRLQRALALRLHPTSWRMADQPRVHLGGLREAEAPRRSPTCASRTTPTRSTCSPCWCRCRSQLQYLMRRGAVDLPPRGRAGRLPGLGREPARRAQGSGHPQAPPGPLPRRHRRDRRRALPQGRCRRPARGDQVATHWRLRPARRPVPLGFNSMLGDRGDPGRRQLLLRSMRPPSRRTDGAAAAGRGDTARIRRGPRLGGRRSTGVSGAGDLGREGACRPGAPPRHARGLDRQGRAPRRSPSTTCCWCRASPRSTRATSTRARASRAASRSTSRSSARRWTRSPSPSSRSRSRARAASA